MATAAEIKNMGVSNVDDAEKSANQSDLQVMMDELKRLRTENDEFKKRQRPVTFSVSEKGAISVYGIGKFPCSLYRVQWERILEKSYEMRQFIAEHAHELN